MVFLAAREILLKKEKKAYCRNTWKDSPLLNFKVFWFPPPKNAEEKKLLFLTLLETEFEIPCLQQLLNSALPTSWSSLSSTEKQ